MHLDEEQLERLLHGELAAEAMHAARGHVAACEECRARTDAARASESRMHALLVGLDHPMPRRELKAVVRQAHVRSVAWMRWAAGLALVVAMGGVAFAAPGSPVRAFLESLWRRVPAEAPTEPPPPAGERAAPAAAGIAVQAGRRLVIEFRSPVEGAQVRVVLGDGEDVVVRAPAGAATFSSRAERVEIGVRAGVTLDVEIPRSAPRVELTLGGRRIFLKAGDNIITGSAADSGASWLLPLGNTP